METAVLIIHSWRRCDFRVGDMGKNIPIFAVFVTMFFMFFQFARFNKKKKVV